MLITSAPQVRNTKLSARELKRGPSIVTIVPFEWHRRPSFLAVSMRTCKKEDPVSNHTNLRAVQDFVYLWCLAKYLEQTFTKVLRGSLAPWKTVSGYVLTHPCCPGPLHSQLTAFRENKFMYLNLNSVFIWTCVVGLDPTILAWLRHHLSRPDQSAGQVPFPKGPFSHGLRGLLESLVESTFR